MSKLYGGPALRRLRTERHLNQVEFARLLAISPSYLNQLEHDTRPLTASVLMRLSEVFGVDASTFSPQDLARRQAELREALASVTADPGICEADLLRLSAQYPQVSESIVALYRHRQQLAEHLRLARSPTDPPVDSDPHQEVRDFFYRHHNYIDALDRAAERTAVLIGAEPDPVERRLRDHLGSRHGIEVVTEPAARHPRQDQWLHHVDPRAGRLVLSEHLSAGQRAFRMATHLALLEQEDTITRTVDEAELRGREARRLARIGLAQHYAGALILPYTPFHEAAETLRYDVDLLARRFGVGPETIAHRLSTLQRPRARGVPFLFIRVDRAGNISKRQSATGFHFSRAGGACPLWNVYESFTRPGNTIVQIAAMPDGQRYLWIARTVTRRTGGHGDPFRIHALGLGCEIRHAPRLVYSQGLPLDDLAASVPIGPGCRTCDRDDCVQRAAARMGVPLDIDELASTAVPYRTRPGPERSVDTAGPAE
jgi:predicted transcriptional regulator/plasmid maintenance system antidote protein VapI